MSWIALLLVLFAGEARAQQSCTRTVGQADRVLWDDGPAVTVIVPPELESAFDNATNFWNNSACGQAGGSRKVPPFNVVTSPFPVRGAGQTPTNSIIVFPETTPRVDSAGRQMAQWQGHDDITGLDSVLLIPAVDINGNPIDMDTPYLTMIYTHELGHALGIGHDRLDANGASCPQGIMTEGNIDNPAILDSYCDIIEQVQEPVCNPGSNSQSPGIASDAVRLFVPESQALRPAACPAGCDCPPPDRPDPLDEVLGFCDRFPESCPSGGDDPWWDDPGFLFDWGVSCTVVSWGGSGVGDSGFSVDCRVIYYYSRPIGSMSADAAGRPVANADETDFEGDGPAIRLDTLAEGSTQQGRIEIKGSAVSPDGVGGIAIWLDNQPITLEEWKTGQPWGNCSHPRGGTDPDCPNVGFSGFLDVSKLTPGQHTLQVVAVDRRNPYPRPSMLMRTFNANRACTDTTKPTINLTAPAPAATVGGTTTVSVNAADNVGVAKVQFFIDGVFTAEDRTAPWEMRWDTRRVSNGNHTLVARAIDACENIRYSESIFVTTQNGDNSPRARNDRAATNVGVGILIDVLANDVDPDHDLIELAGDFAAKLPNHGTIAREGQKIRYVPAAGYEGNDGFRYRIVDATGRTDTGWVAIEISGINGKPVAVDDTATAQTNRTIAIEVLANDTDPDGDLLSLVGKGITQPALHGFAERVSRTTVAYTPGRGFNGKDRFQYEIGDGKGRRARAWVNVTVSDTNRAPVAANDSAATAGTTAVTINVTANDSDPDGDDVLLISNPIVVAPTHGTATRVSGSSITYVPAAGYTGSDSFQYEIGDGNGKRARATVSITITDSNRDPVADADAATTTTNTGITVNVTANDSDPDGDPVTLKSIVTAPLQGTAVKINGSSVTYTPKTGFTGTDVFTYEIGDGRGRTARANVTVTINATGGNNHNPVAADDNVTARPGVAVDINVTANDSDPDGDPVTLITSPIVTAPAKGTATKVSGTTIRYTSNANFVGVDTFQYEVGDGRGKRARAWVRISVTDTNNRPSARDDAARVSPNGEVTINLTANDTDPDGDTVTLIGSPIIIAPTHGTAVKISGTSVKYTPAAGYFGTDRFQYEIGDGRGARSRAWVDVKVSYDVIWAAVEIANMPPKAMNDLIVSRQGETVLSVVTNDADPDHDYLALTAQAIVTPPQYGTIRRVSDTEVAYTPQAGFGGNDAFEYEVVDPNGVPSRAWVALHVPLENEAPVAKADAIVVAAGREGLLDVVANDLDADLGELKLTETALASWPSSGTVRRISDRELAYAPNPGFAGADSFVYEITDGRGATARATVSVTVTDQNIAPVAVNDSYTTDSGVAIALPVLANDSDPNGDALRIVSSSQPANGSVTWDPDASAPGVFTPAPGFVGTTNFTYTVSDAAGIEASANVTITVKQVRRAPIVNADSADTKTLTAVLIGVLANDFDLDGNKLTVKSVSTPSSGTAVVNRSESVIYTPANGFSGTVTFTYVAADGTGMETTGTVTVRVLNEAPLAKNDSYAGYEDTWVGYNAWQFLNNDSDADGHELKIIAVTQPANGQLLTAPDYSSFSYKPKPEWAGVDGFWYTISDGFGGTSQAWVQLSVQASNDPPVANNDTASVYKNQLLTLTQAQLIANDTDIENHGISVYSVGPATNGTTVKLANGSIEYRPYGEFVGSDSFEYTIQDGGGAYAVGRVNVTVLQDTAPVPNFTVTCAGRVCNFDASASTDDRGIILYQWTLGNNQAASGKTFTYTYPLAGTYQVRLTIQDTLYQTAATYKVVIVTEPPPDAKDDSYTWRKGYARYVEYTSMLANDTDPNNDVLTVQSVDSSLTDGTVTCDSTGCLFQPPSSYWMGQTSFKYTVSDGHGRTDTATVYINFTY